MSGPVGGDEHLLLAEAVGRFAEKVPPDGSFDRAAWAELVASGFAGVGVGETAGGSGGGIEDALVVVDVLARRAVSLPAGDQALVAGWLCERVGWSLPDDVVAVSITSADDLRVEGNPAAPVLTGTLDRVPWGRAAAQVLVVADGPGGCTVWRVPVAACRVQEGASVAGEPRDGLVLDAAPVDGVATVDPGTAATLLCRGALVRAAQMAGAIETVVAITVDHVKGRQQFGRPLSAFQAVRHATAVMAGEVAASSAAVSAAARTSEGTLSQLAVGSAKVRCAAAATRVARIAHELHGAIGTTQEHELGRYTRRLWAWRDEYGTERYWQKHLGRLAARSTGGLWATLTAGDAGSLQAGTERVATG